VERARYLVQSVVFEHRSVREVARQHGVSKTWLYELVARYQEGGEAALAPRSKRPKSSPNQISADLENEIVELRKFLGEEGLDAGAVTIHSYLLRHNGSAPAVSSIWRVLNGRGLVTPQPQKRPRSSYVRFEAELPNHRWQMDVTHVEMARGKVAEVLNVIDDHSRLCVASQAFSVVGAEDVVAVFAQAADTYGLPATVLSDNGAIFTASYRHGRCLTEIVFESHGIEFRHARPYHPQTCGKIERFHQTEKKYLRAHRRPRSLAELQERLDVFIAYYNEVRPHRALRRRTPAEAHAALMKAGPAGAPSASFLHYRIRNDRVDKNGKITVRYAGVLRHLGVGHAHKGQRVLALVADRDVRVLSVEGRLLGQFHIDPAKNYQAKLAD
jgi:transposase InsO family protein